MKERVVRYLSENGLTKIVDKTMYRGGSLWVITDRLRRVDAAFFAELRSLFGVAFVYAPRGGRSTDHHPAWFWVPNGRPAAPPPNQAYNGPFDVSDLRRDDQPAEAGPAFCRGYSRRRPGLHLPTQADYGDKW